MALPGLTHTATNIVYDNAIKGMPLMARYYGDAGYKTYWRMKYLSPTLMKVKG